VGASGLQTESGGFPVRACAIVILSIVAAVAYGVVHDQITARVCVEYFTVGHPPVFATNDPTLLGLGWGILATWWVGLIVGVGLVLSATAGSRPPRTVRSLVRPVLALLVVTGLSAAMMGGAGYLLAEAGSVSLLEPLASDLPREKHARFLADLWAHNTSYAVGFVGGFVVMVRVWRSR
jgi:hypothetical protein